MNNTGKKKFAQISLFLFIIFVFISISIVSFFQRKSVEGRKALASSIGSVILSRVSNSFYPYFDITGTISMMIEAEGGKIKDYSDIFIKLIEEKPFINDIVISPAERRSFLYKAPSMRLIRVSSVTTAEKSSEYENTRITGPVKSLNSDELLLTSYRNIYFTRPDGVKDYWGCVSVSVKLTSFMNSIFNTRLFYRQSFRTKIYSNDPVSGKKTLVFQSDELPLNDPVVVKAHGIFDGWSVYLSPEKSWLDIRGLIICSLLSLFISVVFSQLIYLILIFNSEKLKMEGFAYNDSLTRLNNKRKFSFDFGLLEKNNKSVGIVYLDLNDFKYINDTFGHETGDSLLKIVARKLDNNIRSIDSVYRIGGDEFVILVNGETDSEFYKILKKRLETSVSSDTVIGDLFIKTGISIGYARIPQDTSGYSEALILAEKNMYIDKRAKKNRAIYEHKLIEEESFYLKD